MRPIRLLLVLALLSPAAWAQKTQPVDSEQYRDAVAAFNRGQINDAESRLRQINSPLLRKLAEAALMSQPGNAYSFAELSAFISDNPAWPGLAAIRQNAEDKLPGGLNNTQLVNWFKANPPITLGTFDLMISALRATGQETTAQTMIRERWITGSFGSVEQTDFLKRYSRQLRARDHWSRLDRLLWDGTESAAARMLPLVTKGQAALARARMEPGKRSFARVPPSLANDPGLVYIKLKQARQKDQDGTAVSLLAHQPHDPAQAGLWWSERSIIARRYLVKNQHQRAYDIAARHRLAAGSAYVQAEFLAGWIALRYLHKPDTAIRHFKDIAAASSLPISKSRAAYWLGRAYEAKKMPSEAHKYYAEAALYPTAYYGQLAQAALEPGASLTVRAQQIAAAERQAFNNSETTRLAALLTDLGDRDRAGQFIMAAAAKASTHAEFALLAEWANTREMYELAVRLAKRAAQRGFLLDVPAYPVPDYLFPDQPEPALVLGLIRQESMFNPAIVSPAQAVGLMQLLPSTGRATARQLNLPFSNGRLTDPNYNIRLGSRFLTDRIDQFNGSFIMAIASYNAGPTRVRQWMEKIGDPRTGKQADAIDWVELIPVYETRNYVQRVLEATQIYRARLQRGSARLLIIEDLTAGTKG